MIKKYAAFEELDRPLLMALIDKIVVGDTHIEDGEKSEISASYTTSSARWTANDEYSLIQVYRE